MAEILNEMLKKIEDKNYKLKELKTLLVDTYNQQNKRTSSGYNKYMSEKMRALKNIYPGTKSKELLGLASSGWKSLSDKEKEHYNKLDK